MRPATLAAALFAALQPPSASAQPQSPFLDRYVGQAEQQRDAGDLAAALASVGRALERDPRSLRALALRAELARALEDLDGAVHALHQWSDIVAAAKRSPVPAREKKARAETLLELDPEARAWDKLQAQYVKDLMALGKDYQKKEDWLAALEVYAHLLQVDPQQRAAETAIRTIRRKGGAEVAVEDVYAGADPTFGKTPEQVEKQDLAHGAWSNAWKKDTDNYRYRTNAGYLVLETSAIAMEQMNRFYRKFFRFKLDGGKTPKIEIRIFKNRDEYLELGASPQPWSAGHFIGSAVETYIGGVTGTESIRGMYRTLFHEAAHQFVSLTGPFVPGWLNEAYASFFEGCVILSNGSVEWNKVPAGRLFPLAERMQRGWMKDLEDGVRDESGEWASPERAPTFRQVVEGDYAWGPPWYAPTWGVVYFLYNYRADDGRPVYRDALHEYYLSFKRGRPAEGAAHFEETVLQQAPLSPVRDVDALNEIWRDWILRLRDLHTGKLREDSKLAEFGDAATKRGDLAMALSFYQEALEQQPGDVDLLAKAAALHEELDQDARAAATYRELKRELELKGRTDDPRHAEAQRKVQRLDPLYARYQRIKQRLAERGLALARGYDERELPTMALEIARRMSANFSVPEALAYYIEIARRTGLSLARWRVAYDERTLDGWSGDKDVYQPYGDQIRARVAEDPEAGGGLATRVLACDVTFDADFSLEAKMRIPGGRDGGFAGSLMGLCFGRKGDQDFHAVMLHPKGYMDIATNRGGVWEVLDHRSMPVGTDWHTLRIDVTGQDLDVYADGFYVRSVQFPSRESVAGSFGLLTGPGDAAYKDIRILPRDRHDPAAAIERRLAMERIAADASLRQEGSFAGIAPPELRGVDWLQGEPVTLAQLRGRPVMLVFWSPAQEQVIPTAAYYRHLIARAQSSDLAVVVVCDAGTQAGTVLGALEDQPLPGAHVGRDAGGRALNAFYVRPGHHGMPRVLLIDRAGNVQFEGDPGLKAGVGWEPGTETYVDPAFERLLR